MLTYMHAVLGELVKCFSWDAGHNHPIHVVFGPPVQIATIRKKSEGATDMRPFKESSMKLIRESIDKVCCVCVCMCVCVCERHREYMRPLTG
jgi:hypothetical protein